MTRCILLVDDESDNLEPIRLILGEEFRVLTAQSAKEALSVLEKEPAELVISDQRMPGMSGVELLTRVKELYPEVVRIILTAFTDYEAMLAAVNEGQVYRYVLKPWNADEMSLVVRQALEWKDLRGAMGQLAADLEGAHRALRQRTLELEKAQEALVRQEKMAIVGRYAAEMAHEMKNYLQVILAINRRLSSDLAKNAESAVTDLKTLEVQTALLSDIAAGIRDFARGAGVPFAVTLTDPVEPAREVLGVCALHPGFHGLKLSLVKGEAPPWLLDGRHIKHLLLNLLKNAAQASRQHGEIALHVEAVGDELRYRVVDHGIGVSEADRARIWEPFFSTWTRDGAGLGLCVCRKVADQHGGTLEVEDTPGGGATFSLRIPRGATKAASVVGMGSYTATGTRSS